MTASNGSLSSPEVPPAFEETERGVADRVSEALWQAQVRTIHSQEWFNFASDGYLLTDVQGVIQEANYAAAAFLDARKEFLLGKPLGLLMTPDNRRHFYVRLAYLAQYGGVQRWEARLCRPNGQPRDVTLTAAALADEQGQDACVRWMLHDVSRARQVERAWLAEKNLADCLLEAAEIFILLVDELGKILRCNPHALAVSGYDADELHEQSWCDRLLPEREREAAHRLLIEARICGSSRSGVLDLSVRDGPRRRVLWSARQCGGMLLLIGHDVTQLEEAQRQALQAERLAAIGQLAAGLGHESRNALQRSQACLALLGLRLQGQPDCLELLGRIEKAQDDLQRLFEDVRSYAVAPRLERHWCNLSESWREAWNNLADLPEWSTAELCEDTDNVDLFCEADPFALRQVFRNLLENTLSCGASPVRVVLRCQAVARGTTETLCIRLRDNGPGIPAERRAQLFEPFFTTKTRGTGLGLAICRRILEAHGGSIHVEETTVSGTEMVLTLPRRGT